MADNGKKAGLLLHNVGIFNPVLVQAVGLCPVVAMATTLKGAALLAAIAAVTITLCEFIASAFLKVIPRWIRTGIYIIIGCAIVAPFMYLIEKINPELFGTLGIYLPLMAVNSLLVLRCERFAVKIKPLQALADGATASLGYAAVLLLVGAMREILGKGSIAGFNFWDGRTLTGLLLPFGGFLMLGFAGAALRTLISAYWPQYLDQKQPKPGFDEASPVERKLQPIPELPDLSPEESPLSQAELEFENDFEDDELPQATPAHTEKAEDKAADEADLQTANENTVLAVSQPVIEETEIQENSNNESTVQPDASEQEPSPEPNEEAAAQAESEAEPEKEENKAAEKPEKHSASQDIKIEFKELTLEDVLADDKAESASKPEAHNSSAKTDYLPSKRAVAKPISFDNDDELEALMNRSLDDIFGPAKEDKK